MATLLFLHAHPDDECILTGATIARAHTLGHRVVVAYATRGDAGVTRAELGGQTLGERREEEARAACAELGVDRVVFLGFEDSGMAGSQTAGRAEAFCNVDLDEITARLGMAMVAETIDVLVGYDANGTYGHPDHVQVHRAAHHAAGELGVPWLLEATYDRSFFAGLEEQHYGEIGDGFASAAEEITHIVRDRDAARRKAAAVQHHRSQVPEDWDEDEPDLEGFERAFGTEWFIARAVQPDADRSLLEPLFAAAAA